MYGPDLCTKNDNRNVYLENRRGVFVAVMFLEKAYNRVDRKSVLGVLRMLGVEVHLLEWIRIMAKSFKKPYSPSWLTEMRQVNDLQAGRVAGALTTIACAAVITNHHHHHTLIFSGLKLYLTFM